MRLKYFLIALKDAIVDVVLGIGIDFNEYFFTRRMKRRFKRRMRQLYKERKAMKDLFEPKKMAGPFDLKTDYQNVRP